MDDLARGAPFLFLGILGVLEMMLWGKSGASRPDASIMSSEPQDEAREEDEQGAAFEVWLGDFFGDPSDTDDIEGQSRSDGG